MNQSMIEVVFKVHAEVQYGEEVYLSGNIPELGCFNIDRAIQLVTSSSEFPWWRTKEGLFLPGDAGFVKYRYCIFSGGKFVRWEGDANDIRTLDAGKSKSLVKITEDKFGILNYEFPQCDKTNVNQAVLATSDAHAMRARLYASWNRKDTDDNRLTANDGVIMVSYFLPVILSKSPTGTWSASWDREALLSLQMEDIRCVWVGSVRYNNAPIPVEEEDAVAMILQELNCFPVFINQTMHLQFYDGFCKKSLWMIMHHIADVYGPMNHADQGVRAQQHLWYNYNTVHKMFTEKVLEVYQQGYMVWIHGFHLMLLPTMIRRRIAQAKIGYFFHTPFPSSEIWRTMARREDLLRGILGADQIGFHLFEYARHFMTTCHRLLGYNAEMNPDGMSAVNVDGRQVIITCIHVGIDLVRLQEIVESVSFASEIMVWKKRFAKKVVISGIDRLERLKAIPLRLMAIDRFLTDNPEWIGKVVFALIGITAGERRQDYKQTIHDVRYFVNTINEKYRIDGTSDPIIYFEERHDKEIRLAQRLAFFAASDILLMTATRDGLNRYPMEFTVARKMHGTLLANGILPKEDMERRPGAGAAHEGIVIISEFISAARVMRGAMIVNPWRLEEVLAAIQNALTMSFEDRAERCKRNQEFATRLTTSNWAKQVLSDLKSVQSCWDPNSIALGFGLQYKVMNLKAGFHVLDVKEVNKAYRTARQRLILLDWGGTLVPNVDKQDKFLAYSIATGQVDREGPSQELIGVLETLCADKKNLVFVVSGKEIRAVSDYFGSIKGLGLGAEHGFYYRWPERALTPTISPNTSSKFPFATLTPSSSSSATTTGNTFATVATTGNNANSSQLSSNSAKWQTIMEHVNNTWRESAKLVMNVFVQRTHGTYIEQKGNALIWQFSDADPEFGFMQSKELEEHLSSILAHYPVEIIRGGGVSDGYIEVRPTGASKGLFLEHCLTLMKTTNNDPDFILTIGDDSSDEPMFERMASLLHDNSSFSSSSSSSSSSSASVAAFSVTVGKKPSAANAYLDDPTAVIELLTTLGKNSRVGGKFYSMADFGTTSDYSIDYHQPLLTSASASFYLNNGNNNNNNNNNNIGTSNSGKSSQSIESHHPVVRGSSLGGLGVRAMSMGHFTYSGSDSFLKRSSLPSPRNNPSLTNAADPTTPGGAYRDYLSCISEDQVEEDEGIFF